MPVVTRASIARISNNPKVKKVMTPVWGSKSFVYVRTMRASEIDDVQRIADATKGDMGTANAMVEWCIMGACDAKGKRIFNSDSKKHLLGGPLAPIQDIVTELMDLNGIGDDAEKN